MERAPAFPSAETRGVAAQHTRSEHVTTAQAQLDVTNSRGRKSAPQGHGGEPRVLGGGSPPQAGNRKGGGPEAIVLLEELLTSH